MHLIEFGNYSLRCISSCVLNPLLFEIKEIANFLVHLEEYSSVIQLLFKYQHRCTTQQHFHNTAALTQYIASAWGNSLLGKKGIIHLRVLLNTGRKQTNLFKT